MCQDKKAAPLGGPLDAPSILAGTRDPERQQSWDEEARARLARGESVFETLPDGREVELIPDAEGNLTMELCTTLSIEHWPMFAEALKSMHECYSSRTWEDDLDKVRMDNAAFSLSAERLIDAMRSAGANNIGELLDRGSDADA